MLINNILSVNIRSTALRYVCYINKYRNNISLNFYLKYKIIYWFLYYLEGNVDDDLSVEL